MTECNNLREMWDRPRKQCDAPHIAHCVTLHIAHRINHFAHCTLINQKSNMKLCKLHIILHCNLHFARWSTKEAIWRCANCNHPAILGPHIFVVFELIKDYLLTAKRARGLLLLNCNLTLHKLGWTGHLNSKYCRKAISWHPSRAFGGALSSLFQWQLAGQYDGLVSGLVFFFLPTIFMGRMIFLQPANIRWLATCCVTALVVV